MTGYFALKEPLHVIMFGKKIRTDVAEKGLSASQNSFLAISTINQGLLNRWTSQLDLGCTTGCLERVVSVHNST